LNLDFFTRIKKSQDGSLSIFELKLSDAGHYMLAASNRDANATIDFLLVVKGSIRILLSSLVAYHLVK